jgi:hypothetical protein
LRDRQRAILQFHDLPAELPDLSQLGGSAPHQPHHGPPMNLPFAPAKQAMSALETLAEVSRQHLEERVGGKQRGKTPPPPPLNHSSSHGALLDEFLVDDRPDGFDLAAVSQDMDVSGAPALPSIYQFNGSLQHSPTTSPHMGHVSLSSSSSMNQIMPSLVMTASAANELSNIMPLSNGLMEPELNAPSNNGISDKFFHSQVRQHWPSLPSSSIDPMLHEHNGMHLPSKDDNVTKSVSQPRPIAMNPNGSQAHFTTDFSVSQKPPKPKVRGRFTDTRRKEVQEVRKRGACLRCRMLKKPCSGDSPCTTCQNVESARLWKSPCIRTRVADEFHLYSVGLQGVLAFHAVSQAKGQVLLDPIPGRIEATHHLESALFATFAPLKCQSQALPSSDIDPAIIAAMSPSSLEIIDGEDDIGGKIDAYVKKSAASYYESEDSPLMKITLRSAYGVTTANPDGLLPKVIELWNLTQTLTSRTLQWHIFSNPSMAPTIQPSSLSSADLENASRTPITTVNNRLSYDLIKMQLLAATEKRAASLAKVVMNDLERRLLQRQQASPFETFLIAVILLACVERMCWLFRTWEDQTPPAAISPTDPNLLDVQKVSQPQSTTDDSLAAALQSNPLDNSTVHPIRNPKWPLDKPPAHFSQQGERFSDILHMLLKMRGVPPKPVPRSTDGMLVMWGDEVDEKVKEWYDGIEVTVDMLNERREARFIGVDPREWELKFIGKIIAGG